MSQNAYKGQKYAELFSINNQNLLNKWQVLPSVKKMYDKNLKTFVYNLKGKSPIPLMRFSKDKTMELDHPILVFQIYFAAGANVLFDIGVCCCNNLHKRITLSSNQKIQLVTLLSVTLPLSVKHAGTWSHLILDIEDVVSTIWKRETFRCIDFIRLSGTCNIKRIFTLQKDLIHTQEGMCFIKYDEMPKQMLLSRNDSPIYNMISCSNDFKKEDSKSLTSSCADHSISSSRSSCSSGHFKVTRNTYRSRKSISKSTKSSGSISENSVSNESDLNLYHEDVRERITDESAAINEDHIIPFLSKLSFSRTTDFSRNSKSLIQEESEMSRNALFTTFSSELNAKLHSEKS